MEVDEYFIKMAQLVSLRGTCLRRKVGCVLTNNLNHVIATGYNGRARGVTNCLERPCEGSRSSSGQDLDKCEAIHAEANALLQCSDVEAINTAYCTTSPCVHCIKLLMNTSCQRIVFSDRYPGHEQLRDMWESSREGRIWEHFPEQMTIYEIDEVCEHRHWVSSSKRTKSDSTIFRECTECGLLKEIGV